MICKGLWARYWLRMRICISDRIRRLKMSHGCALRMYVSEYRWATPTSAACISKKKSNSPSRCWPKYVRKCKQLVSLINSSKYWWKQRPLRFQVWLILVVLLTPSRLRRMLRLRTSKSSRFEMHMPLKVSYIRLEKLLIPILILHMTCSSTSSILSNNQSRLKKCLMHTKKYSLQKTSKRWIMYW